MEVRMMERFSDEIAGEPRIPRRTKLVGWATLGVLGVLAAAAALGGLYAASNGDSPGSPASPVTAAAAAATSSSSPGPSASASKNDQRGPRGLDGHRLGGRGFGFFGGLGAAGRVLHGESTVVTANGETTLVDLQRGTITAIDASKKTIRVTSSDKVAFTYLIDADTRLRDFAAAAPAKATFADLKVGDTVEVVAIRTGETRTAKGVIDAARTRGMDHPRGPGGTSVRPSASATATDASA
jgi:hypothetical protein